MKHQHRWSSSMSIFFAIKSTLLVSNHAKKHTFLSALWIQIEPWGEYVPLSPITSCNRIWQWIIYLHFPTNSIHPMYCLVCPAIQYLDEIHPSPNLIQSLWNSSISQSYTFLQNLKSHPLVRLTKFVWLASFFGKTLYICWGIPQSILPAPLKHQKTNLVSIPM